MPVPTFRFTIALPPDAGYAALFRDLANQMALFIGLAEQEAEQAGDVLARLVTERLRRASDTGDTVTISFERPDDQGPVTVEVSGPGVASDAALAAGAGLVVEQAGGRTRLHLAWQPRD
jgi:hypothetical protein